MDRKINRRKRIQTASEYSDRWLMRKQRRHERMILVSLRKLTQNIIDQIYSLETSSGNILTAQQNLNNAQRIHRDIEAQFRLQWEVDAKTVVNEFQDVITMVQRSLSIMDDSIEWSGISEQSLQILNSGAWRGIKEISNTQKNKVIQAVYDNVIAGEKFSTLVETIEQSLIGSKAKGVMGRPLVQYAQLYARDTLMIYQNEVTISAADDLEMNHFLYVGDIIATTRDFCRRRAGKVYTKKQIQSWKYKWAGKSGPAMTHRGGYNCRHHWQPIRPEWLDGETKIDIGNWNLENVKGG